MKKFSSLFSLLGLLVLGLALTPGLALAQTAPNGDYQAGPYTVRITFDRDTFKSAQEFFLTVERLDKAAPDWQLQAEAVPLRGTSATPVKYDGNFETSEPSKRLVKLQLPISGNWFVHLTLKGSAGQGELRLPVKAEPPPVIEYWLAWLIGLSPIVGLIGFGIGQWRHVVRRKREARLVGATPTQETPVLAGLPTQVDYGEKPASVSSPKS